MELISCPSCGGEVSFRSPFTLFRVCGFCESMLVRKEGALKDLGKVATLPNDVSPLQIGTKGRYKGQHFELLGRIKMRWKNGTWDEWYVLFKNGRDGWLAHAQGAYMMMQQDSIKGAVHQDTLHPGIQVPSFDNMTVVDVKTATRVSCEGELPKEVEPGISLTSVDLSKEGENKFGNIEFCGREISVFSGSYVEFDRLNFESLRELDGWN